SDEHFAVRIASHTIGQDKSTFPRQTQRLAIAVEDLNGVALELDHPQIAVWRHSHPLARAIEPGAPAVLAKHPKQVWLGSRRCSSEHVSGRQVIFDAADSMVLNCLP